MRNLSLSFFFSFFILLFVGCSVTNNEPTKKEETNAGKELPVSISVENLEGYEGKVLVIRNTSDSTLKFEFRIETPNNGGFDILNHTFIIGTSNQDKAVIGNKKGEDKDFKPGQNITLISEGYSDKQVIFP